VDQEHLWDENICSGFASLFVGAADNLDFVGFEG